MLQRGSLARLRIQSAAMNTERRALREALLGYAGEAGTPALFVEFLDAHPLAFERGNAFGHFTGSAWLVSADGERVLLTHHRKLNAWLQLGGHADGDAALARVALREAGEESGLRDLVVDAAIFDIDRHRIPARGEEPEHWHYDVRYVVRATGNEAFVVGDESHALAWRDIRSLGDDPDIDASVRRMSRKWLAR
jgi:8-oxo-dGTP pyrophosphatase MutT (NUDIX family)